MEAVATGFNPALGQVAQARQNVSLPPARGNEQTARDQQTQARPENTSRTPESSNTNGPRVITGEVISSETVRVNGDPTYPNLTRSSLSNQQEPNTQPDPRRITQQQALQNFQQNEEMVVDQNSMRQVSGIIDVYV